MGGDPTHQSKEVLRRLAARQRRRGRRSAADAAAGSPSRQQLVAERVQLCRQALSGSGERMTKL